MLLAALLSACVENPLGIGPDAPEPPEITIEISPSDPGLEVGSTLQLTAETTDDDGNPTFHPVTWNSSDTSIVRVSDSGLLTALAEGQTQIEASAAGASAEVTATVTPAGSIVVGAISPEPLVGGEAATLEGTGFSPVASENRVTVGGLEADITQASETSLDIVVPGCLPAGSVPVRASTLAGASSVPVEHPFESGDPSIDLPVGQQLILQDPASFCLRFAPSAAPEAYLIGVQSGPGGGLTQVLLTAAVDDDQAAGGAIFAAAPLPPRQGDVSHPRARWEPEDAEMRRRHRAAELRLRVRERRLLGSALRRVPQPSKASVAAVPSNLEVGDVLTIEVPVPTGPQNTTFFSVTAEVREIGDRVVWLEDTENPDGGFTDADVQSLIAGFEGRTFGAVTDYFGPPTDIDGNERVVVVATKELNQTEFAGFTFACDLHPGEGICGSTSNQGEIFYVGVPDPEGVFGEPREKSDVLAFLPVVLAHEFVHVIQFAAADNAPVWFAEGQATLGEEITGHAWTGRSAGHNYGPEVAFNDPPADDIAWYAAPFARLIPYYGFVSETEQRPNTPEQCNWTDRRSEACVGDQLPYGVSWTFLRWLSDHFGADFAGGESGLHKALIEERLCCFSAIENVVREPLETLLAQWAAMLYVDDRIPGVASRLTLPSWNLFAIEQALPETARLEPHELTFSKFRQGASVNYASTAYFRISGPSRPATVIWARNLVGEPLGSWMQIWIVRLL